MSSLFFQSAHKVAKRAHNIHGRLTYEKIVCSWRGSGNRGDDGACKQYVKPFDQASKTRGDQQNRRCNHVVFTLSTKHETCIFIKILIYVSCF